MSTIFHIRLKVQIALSIDLLRERESEEIKMIQPISLASWITICLLCGGNLAYSFRQLPSRGNGLLRQKQKLSMRLAVVPLTMQ